MSEHKQNLSEMGYEEFIESALYESIPDMDKLRELKKGYNELPIDRNHPKFNEPVIDIAKFGIAGQAYYSRPNAATKKPVPGAPTNLYLRRSVVEELARINNSLKNPIITRLFGGEVELYVEDALRPVSLQKKLYIDLFPALIRSNNPGMSEDEVIERRKDLIAAPSADPSKPSPHATGGAVDVILRFKQDTPNYVVGTNVPMGHVDGDTGLNVNPDYFEQIEPSSDEERIAQRNRRAFFAIMTGAAFNVNTDFVNNPTEFWHWGNGDQLAAKVRGDNSAYYSLAESV